MTTSEAGGQHNEDAPRGSPNIRSRKPQFTVGVEEEYQIIDPLTRELRQRAESTLSNVNPVAGKVVTEVRQSQLEASTPVCHTLAEVRGELIRMRKEVADAARATGVVVAAAGTHPFSNWADQAITPKERYRTMTEDYQQLTREQVIFGYHVHVDVGSREAAILTMNRTHPWLAPLLALSSSSPFWLGSDTGYASFRALLWERWPAAGIPVAFDSLEDYEHLVTALIDAEIIRDESSVYWDLRPSVRFDTLEFRVADVCSLVDEAVMIAGLIRALTQTCYELAVRDEPFQVFRPELLKAAKWRAARDGVEGVLVDLETRQSVPASELIDKLLVFLRPALEDSGEWEEASWFVRETVKRGSSAARQRRIFQHEGRLEAVVDLVISETEPP